MLVGHRYGSVESSSRAFSSLLGVVDAAPDPRVTVWLLVLFVDYACPATARHSPELHTAVFLLS